MIAYLVCRRRPWRFIATALGTALVLYAPVVLSAGVGKSWDLLIKYPLTDFSDYQSLPFPFRYHGILNTSSIGGFFSDSSEEILHFYLPLVLVIGLLACLSPRSGGSRCGSRRRFSASAARTTWSHGRTSSMCSRSW